MRFARLRWGSGMKRAVVVLASLFAALTAAPAAAIKPAPAIYVGEKRVFNLDARDRVSEGRYYDTFRLYLHSGQCVQVTMRSLTEGFNPRVDVGAAVRLANPYNASDKSEEGSAAETRFCVPTSWGPNPRIFVWASSASAQQIGRYTLEVNEFNGSAPPVEEALVIPATYPGRDRFERFVLDPDTGHRLTKGAPCRSDWHDTYEQYATPERTLYNLHRFKLENEQDALLIEARTPSPISHYMRGLERPVVEVLDDPKGEPLYSSCMSADARLVFKGKAGQYYVRVSGLTQEDFGEYELSVVRLDPMEPGPPRRLKVGYETDGQFDPASSPLTSVRYNYGAPYDFYMVQDIKPGRTYKMVYEIQQPLGDSVPPPAPRLEMPFFVVSCPKDPIDRPQIYADRPMTITAHCSGGENQLARGARRVTVEYRMGDKADPPTAMPRATKPSPLGAVVGAAAGVAIANNDVAGALIGAALGYHGILSLWNVHFDPKRELPVALSTAGPVSVGAQGYGYAYTFSVVEGNQTPKREYDDDSSDRRGSTSGGSQPKAREARSQRDH